MAAYGPAIFKNMFLGMFFHELIVQKSRFTTWDGAKTL